MNKHLQYLKQSQIEMIIISVCEILSIPLPNIKIVSSNTIVKSKTFYDIKNNNLFIKESLFHNNIHMAEFIILSRFISQRHFYLKNVKIISIKQYDREYEKSFNIGLAVSAYFMNFICDDDFIKQYKNYGEISKVLLDCIHNFDPVDVINVFSKYNIKIHTQKNFNFS